jgi:hypothetical protein
MEGAYGEPALLFHIEFLGHGRESLEFASELYGVLQNNFCAAVVVSYFPPDLDGSSNQGFQGSHVMQVFGEYDHGKWARARVFAEVQITHAFGGVLHAKDLAAYAGFLAHVLLGFREGGAFSRWFGGFGTLGESGEYEHQEYRN